MVLLLSATHLWETVFLIPGDETLLTGLEERNFSHRLGLVLPGKADDCLRGQQCSPRQPQDPPGHQILRGALSQLNKISDI